jgi:hypothetical protein
MSQSTRSGTSANQQAQRAARENLFEFVPKPMEGLKQYLDFVSAQWDDALSRLKSFVEE